MPDDLPFSSIGGYRLGDRIGSGSSSTVYEAHRGGQRFALKILHPHYAADRQARARFEREAKLLVDLEHPGLIRYFDFGFESGHGYLAMEYVEGENLRDACRPGPSPRKTAADDEITAPISPDSDTATLLGGSNGDSFDDRDFEGTATIQGARLRWLLERFEEAARTLEYLHQHGIIHRDVKPANIVVDATGRARLVDLGIARAATEETVTQIGDFLGTPAYISPEQAMSGRLEVDGRTDIYSLGASLYACVAGRPPFRGRDMRALLKQVLMDDPTSLEKLDPTLPRSLSHVVQKAMEKKPEDRYATAGAMAEDLRNLRNLRAVKAKGIGISRRLARWGRRRPAVSAGLASALLFVLLALFLYPVIDRLRWEARNYSRLAIASADGTPHRVSIAPHDEESVARYERARFEPRSRGGDGVLRCPSGCMVAIQVENGPKLQEFVFRIRQASDADRFVYRLAPADGTVWIPGDSSVPGFRLRADPLRTEEIRDYLAALPPHPSGQIHTGLEEAAKRQDERNRDNGWAIIHEPLGPQHVAAYHGFSVLTSAQWKRIHALLEEAEATGEPLPPHLQNFRRGIEELGVLTLTSLSESISVPQSWDTQFTPSDVVAVWGTLGREGRSRNSLEAVDPGRLGSQETYVFVACREIER